MLKLIDKNEKIPNEYLNTPIKTLLEYHNFGKPFLEHSKPELLIGTCMDYRINLRIPPNYAFIIRNAGASLRYNEFQIAFALSVGGCKAIAVIGHTDCGMVNLSEKRSEFIEKMIKKFNYDKLAIEKYFDLHFPNNAIENEIAFTKKQADELKQKYPNIPIIALVYEVKDNLLYHIE